MQLIIWLRKFEKFRYIFMSYAGLQSQRIF